MLGDTLAFVGVVRMGKNRRGRGSWEDSGMISINLLCFHIICQQYFEFGDYHINVILPAELLDFRDFRGVEALADDRFGIVEEENYLLGFGLGAEEGKEVGKGHYRTKEGGSLN